MVTAVALVKPLNKADAPLPGALNVTVTPLTGLPPFVTVACSAVANAEFTPVLCGVPTLAAMVVTATAVLVKLKLAGVAAPLTVAVTA